MIGVFDGMGAIGRRGGHLYDVGRLARLGRYLERRSVTLKVGDGNLPPNKAGGFLAKPDGTAELILRGNPTDYEVWHELGHYIQWRKLGPDEYPKLPRHTVDDPIQDVPEQFVFDLLENSRERRWRRLTEAEREHAIWYVQEKKGGLR